MSKKTVGKYFEMHEFALSSEPEVTIPLLVALDLQIRDNLKFMKAVF